MAPARHPPPMRSAFSLVELLVVVAILALLISILMPVLGRAKELTRRAVCATQLHNVAQAQGAYASESRNMLPSMKGCAGNWLWDVNKDVVQAYLNCGLVKENLYCPSNPQLLHDDFWLDGVFDGYIVSGYCWIVRQPAPPAGSGALAGGPPLLNNCTWVTNNNSRPSDPVVFDPVVLATWYNTWVWFGHRNAGSTPHMEGDTPAGGNILTVDGHAFWRDFREMTLNARLGPDTFW